MGVQCRLEVVAPDAPLLLDRCFDMVAELENLWSRFLPSSDITRLNHAGGHSIHVDPRTVVLLAAMKSAFSATNGSFNPTRLPEQIASGDAKSLVSNNTTQLPANAHAWTSLDGLNVGADGTITMPATMTLDGGGIAKGFAADLVAEFALEQGATAACINLGGDIRVTNADSHQNDFAIDVLHPLNAECVVSTVSLRNGSIATSAINARRRANVGVDNHIQGAQTELDASSVIASTALWADVWAKHVLVSPDGINDIEVGGLAALTVSRDGTISTTQNWKDFTQC